MIARGMGQERLILRGRVKGNRDPGYGSTSRMLAESAVCLVADEGFHPDVYAFFGNMISLPLAPGMVDTSATEVDR